jgi:hypothetical protein
MGRACSTNVEKGNACRMLVGKPEGKRPLGRLRHRWEDNLKWNIKWGGMDWFDPDRNRGQWRALVNTLMNIRVT